MKPGDKIIWDSAFGYDLGFYQSDKGVSYETCLVKLVTGPAQGKLSVPKHEVLPYTTQNYKKTAAKYGYTTEF